MVCESWTVKKAECQRIDALQPNWEEKLNKAHRLRAKSNSQQKSTPDARTRHQQEGAERRRAGGIP